MKLIDILVEELPKRGGWPDGVGTIGQCYDGQVWYDDFGGAKEFTIIACNARKAGDAFTYGENEITRHQYEAALAAKNDGWIAWGGEPVSLADVAEAKTKSGDVISGLHNLRHHNMELVAYRLNRTTEVKSEWNGEGIPPVGCECEIHNRGEWLAVKIKFIGDKWVVAEPIDGKNEGLYENGMDGEGCYEIADEPERFRPLRTEADRKRYAVIAKLTNVICGEIPDTGTATAAKYAERVYSSIAAGKIPGVKLED